ncbi:MAG: hypothetical protein ACKO26_15360 [Planctomycetota bacterium]
MACPSARMVASPLSGNSPAAAARDWSSWSAASMARAEAACAFVSGMPAKGCAPTGGLLAGDTKRKALSASTGEAPSAAGSNDAAAKFRNERRLVVSMAMISGPIGRAHDTTS